MYTNNRSVFTFQWCGQLRTISFQFSIFPLALIYVKAKQESTTATISTIHFLFRNQFTFIQIIFSLIVSAILK